MGTPTVSPAVNQLAYFWATQNEANKLIFNQLYREAPDVVLRVLTQGQLQPDPAHTSLDEIVAPAGEDAVFNQAGISVSDVTINPPFPAANEPFTVTWKRNVQGEIPDHNDAVQIMKTDGTVVDERPVGRSAAAHGTNDEETMLFDTGLPTGEYVVNVWANLEGNDGTGVPTAQGMRGQGGAELYVGNTEHSQAMQQMPSAGQAMNGVSSAQYAMQQIAALQPEDAVGANDENFRHGMKEAAAALREMPSLGDGFIRELDRIERMLDAEINWRPERESGAVAGLAQRLTGLLAMDAASNPGDLGMAIIQIVDDLY